MNNIDEIVKELENRRIEADMNASAAKRQGRRNDYYRWKGRAEAYEKTLMIIKGEL